MQSKEWIRGAPVLERNKTTSEPNRVFWPIFYPPENNLSLFAPSSVYTLHVTATIIFNLFLFMHTNAAGIMIISFESYICLHFVFPLHNALWIQSCILGSLLSASIHFMTIFLFGFGACS